MRIVVVLDVETRLDPLVLAASGRTAAPRNMPAALQVVTAIAALSFEQDGSGRFAKYRLQGVQVEKECSRAPAVLLAERELARVHALGGKLVTYNGGHDLGRPEARTDESSQVGWWRCCQLAGQLRRSAPRLDARDVRHRSLAPP